MFVSVLLIVIVFASVRVTVTFVPLAILTSSVDESLPVSRKFAPPATVSLLILYVVLVSEGIVNVLTLIAVTILFSIVAGMLVIPLIIGMGSFVTLVVNFALFIGVLLLFSKITLKYVNISQGQFLSLLSGLDITASGICFYIL